VSERSADVVGLTNALLCMAHCLAVPVLVASGAAFVAHPAVELLFIGLAAWAVWSATRYRGPHPLRWTLWTLWVVFSIALLLEHVHPLMEWLGLGASLAMVVAHGLNLRVRPLCAVANH
jgi:hypothetical protein